MTDFSFCNPVRIEFGKGKEEHIGQYMKEAGAKKALVLYGSERVRKSGLMDVVESSLKASGIEFTQLGGIKSNPVLSKVNEAIKLAKEFGADSVLAVGGGSVLDSAKAVTAGACYEGDVWDFFTGKSPSVALKIFDIITLAATGSEMNCGGVVTKEQTRQKYPISAPCLYPKVSVINPQLQATVSLHFINEDTSVGGKAGGLIEHHLNSVEIVCRPRHLPESIEVDMAEVAIGDVIHLRDLKLPEGVRLLHDDERADAVVAQITHPRGAAEEAAESEGDSAE